MNRFLVILILATSFLSQAQTSEKYNSDYVGFFRGQELFEKEQYGAARKEFRDFIDAFQQKNDPLYVKALYYEGVSAIELYNNDGVRLLEDFNRNYPESIYKTKIYFRLGRFYFQQKKYDDAVVWFDKLHTLDIDEDDRNEYFFKKGYANFQEKHFTEARASFFEVKDTTSQYSSPSLYYFSHIAYQEKSYQTALEGFEKLLTDERFKEVVPYYITQIYYLQGRYDEITRFSPLLVDEVKSSNTSNMNHLIGDAFYRVGKYDEAIAYLEKYNAKSKTTRGEDYQLGYAYYRTGEYFKAIKLFDKVSQVKDSLGQIAFYHVGECYLKSGNNAYARTAFDAASRIDIDKKIQEDALYNYAILSYKLDVNPYDEAVEALHLYLTKYPNSDRRNEIYQYLVNVYTTTNRYEAALESLDKLVSKDIRLKTVYQTVAFNYGVELYQKAEYYKAIGAFVLVEKYPIDAKISALGKFWSADANYQVKNFPKAIESYKEFLKMSGNYSTDLRPDAFYNLGYVYLNTAKIPTQNAALEEAFTNYLQIANSKNKAKISDANMRLADYYYISRKNELAIKHYKIAIDMKGGNVDQALYFMALTYGLTDSGLDDKIKYLQDLINNYASSQYVISAVYEVGISYRVKEQDNKAIVYFEQIVRDYPSSILVRDAHINIADIYFKRKDYNKSETLYKAILTDYGTDREVCSNAVKGLANIYKAQKQLDKIESLRVYNCSDDVVDDLEYNYYNAGIEPYMDSAYVEAIKEIQKYLDKYPGGKYEIEMTAYIANAYYRTNKIEQAMSIYRTLLEKPNTEFTELAALRVSRYAYNKKDYAEALKYYSQLEKVTSHPETIYNTRVGLMRCEFLLENWDEAILYANKVLSNSLVLSNIRIEAEYSRGISYFRSNQYEQAKAPLEWLTKNTSNQIASESRYYLAEMNYTQKNYNAAEADIRTLLKMKPSYDFWIAKGLILQTRVLLAKPDLFQAEHTLKSVIDNYKVKDDNILLEANQLWDELMQIKNMPKSTIDKNTNVIEINE